MSELERLEHRLAAVERVVVDGEFQLDELGDLASLSDAAERLDRRTQEHERRLADLEASIQSLEGYVGRVRSVDDDVERQAAAAVATVDRVERRVEAIELAVDELGGGILIDEVDAPTGPTLTFDAEGSTDDVEGLMDDVAGSTDDVADPMNDVEGSMDPLEGSTVDSCMEFDTESGPERAAAELLADAESDSNGAAGAGSEGTTAADESSADLERGSTPNGKGDGAASGLIAAVKSRLP